MAQEHNFDETEFPSSLQPFLANILNAAADGITAQDKSGKLIYANATAARIIGYESVQDLLDAPVTDFPNRFVLFDENGEIFPFSQLPGRQAMQGIESPAIALKFRNKETGEERWSYVQSSPVFNKKGKVEFVVNTFRDITALRLSNEAMREREALYRNVVENANDLIFTLDLAGNFLSLNQAGEALTGYSQEDLLSLRLHELVFPNELALVEEILSQSDGERKRLEIKLRRKDGQPRDVELNTGALIYDREKVGIHGIGRDITDRKRFEIKRRFLAEASVILSSSLDYEVTLKNIAALMTPTLADWSGIDIVQNGVLERVAVSHVDPEKIAWAYELRKAYPVSLDSDTGLARVLRDGVKEFYPDIPDEMLVAGAYNEEHLRLMREVGFRSAIIVPLVAHGKTYGALSLVTTDDSGRRLSQFDLLAAEELGRMAGLAIENSLSYREIAVERERLRVTLTSIGDAVIATDTEGFVTFINTVAEGLTGWPADEAIGRPLTEIFQIINEYSRKPVENPVSKVLETGLIVGLANHTLLISRDNRETPIEDSAAPIRYMDREIHGVVLVFRDVTEDRKAQNEVEIARKNAEYAVDRLSRLQALTSVLSSAATVQQIAHICISQSLSSLGADMGVVALFDKEGKALETIESSAKSPTARYFETLPLDSSLPIVDSAKTGHAIWISSTEAFRQLYPELFADKSKGFRSRSYVSLPLIIEDRTIGSIGFNFLHPMRFDENEQAFIMAMALQCAQALERARLYEAETQARKESEKANQLKMQFLAMISHELRNPLSTIKGSTTGLLGKESKFTKDEQSSLLKVADEAADKLGNLVNQLLDLSRLQSGTLQIEARYQPIETIINEANPELEKLTEHRHLVVYIAKNLPPVWADTSRIAQVLVNLVSNAVKFSPENTYITIVASQLGNRVQVDVSDEGNGIPQDERSAVFEAFRKTNRKQANENAGAGLGLAICKAIIEAHNTEIWIQDKIVGTTISFNLPISEQEN